MSLKKLLVTLCLFVVPLQANDFPKPMGPEIIKKLDLDEETASKVKSIMQASKEKGQSLREAAHSSRQAVHELLWDRNTTESQIRTAVQQAAKQHEELMVLMIKTRNDIDALLTPEQREKIMEMAENRKAKMGEKRQEMQEKMAERRKGRQDSKEGKKAKWAEKRAGKRQESQE